MNYEPSLSSSLQVSEGSVASEVGPSSSLVSLPLPPIQATAARVCAALGLAAETDLRNVPRFRHDVLPSLLEASDMEGGEILPELDMLVLHLRLGDLMDRLKGLSQLF